MREFFRGWRRKAGCGLLTLVMVLTGAWIRSLSAERYSDVPDNLREAKVGLSIRSFAGSCRLVASRFEEHAHALGYYRTDVVVIPYWSVVWPLTLLSAYLILWKPRPKPKEPQGA